MGNCIGNIMSNITHFSEKFSIFLSLTFLLTCAILCMVSMYAFDIGLGSNDSYVDYRSKQSNVAAQYKKATPPYKYGPGYFKALPGNHRPKQRQQSEVTAPDVAGQVDEQSYLSRFEIVEDIIPSQIRSKLSNLKEKKQLEGFYFSKLTTKLGLSLKLDSNSIAETTTGGSIVSDVNVYDRIEEESNAYNDVNATKYKNESESVMFNVSETYNDSAPPTYLMKSILFSDQLSKFLARLRQDNKTFAVHVAIN